MMEKVKIEVTRQHYGDKQYFEGDEREVPETVAKDLVSRGLAKRPEEKKREKKKIGPSENK